MRVTVFVLWPVYYIINFNCTIYTVSYVSYENIILVYVITLDCACGQIVGITASSSSTSNSSAGNLAQLMAIELSRESHGGPQSLVRGTFFMQSFIKKNVLL